MPRNPLSSTLSASSLPGPTVKELDTFDWTTLGPLPPDVSSIVSDKPDTRTSKGVNEALVGSLARLGMLLLRSDYVHPRDRQTTGEHFLGQFRDKMAYVQKMDRESLVLLHEILKTLSAPMGPQELVECVTKCWILCKRRKDHDGELNLTITAFAENLRRYPADAVREVLKQWPEDNTFTPSWAELKALIAPHIFMRKQAWQILKLLARTEDPIQK